MAAHNSFVRSFKAQTRIKPPFPELDGVHEVTGGDALQQVVVVRVVAAVRQVRIQREQAGIRPEKGSDFVVVDKGSLRVASVVIVLVCQRAEKRRHGYGRAACHVVIQIIRLLELVRVAELAAHLKGAQAPAPVVPARVRRRARKVHLRTIGRVHIKGVRALHDILRRVVKIHAILHNKLWPVRIR